MKRPKLGTRVPKSERFCSQIGTPIGYLPLLSFLLLCNQRMSNIILPMKRKMFKL